MPLQEEEDRIRALSLAVSLHCVRIQQEDSHLPTKRGTFPRVKYASTLLLDFTDIRTGRNRCLPFKSPCMWYFVIAA